MLSCTKSKINSVSIDSPPESIFNGGSVQLKAKVNVEGNPDTTINWTIIEPVAKGTFITQQGLLTINDNETARSINIKAISKEDTSKSETRNIKIQIDPKYFYGTWKSIRENKSRNLILTENSLIFNYILDYRGITSYTVSELKWIPAYNDDPATKDDFPSGFYATGIVSKSVLNLMNTGVLQKNILFISKDRKKLLRDTGDSPGIDLIIWSK